MLANTMKTCVLRKYVNIGKLSHRLSDMKLSSTLIDTLDRNHSSFHSVPKSNLSSSLNPAMGTNMDTNMNTTNSSVPFSSLDSMDIQELAKEFRNKHKITIKGVDPSSFHPMIDFETTPFTDKLKKVFVREKYTNPTPIQAQTWPIILSNRDVISIARTGSGKTCGFVLPALHRILQQNSTTSKPYSRRTPLVLIVAPTRELSVQIEQEANKYASAVGLRSLCLYGGSPKFSQIKRLNEGIDVIVGTPGRLNDLSNMGALNLQNVQYLVLDEADRMLDMGFEPQIRAIIEKLPSAPKRQTLFFSATWPREVQMLALDFLSNPILITAGEVNTLNANPAIKQHVYVINEGQKLARFFDLMTKLRKDTKDQSNESNSIMPKTIIFMSRKADCDEMAEALNTEGFPTSSIHGDMGQDQRARTLSQFRKGNIRVLVATDVAARGLDVPDVEVVINYDFPAQGLEDYVHRIGRTARGERPGTSHSFISYDMKRYAKELVELLKRCNQEIPADLLELAISGGYSEERPMRSRYNAPGGNSSSNRPFGNMDRFSDSRGGGGGRYGGGGFGDRSPSFRMNGGGDRGTFGSRGRGNEFESSSQSGLGSGLFANKRKSNSYFNDIDNSNNYVNDNENSSSRFKSGFGSNDRSYSTDRKRTSRFSPPNYDE